MSKMGRPPAKDPKTNKVTIRMTDEAYEKLVKYNEAHQQTITETMSEAFEYFMKNKGKKS